MPSHSFWEELQTVLCHHILWSDKEEEAKLKAQCCFQTLDAFAAQPT